MYTIITENDESQWDDRTGVFYNFPKRYKNFLKPGTKVIYYKGYLKKKEYSKKRLSDLPHYFGFATIGKIIPDDKSNKGDLFAIINDFRKFNEPVLAKVNGKYIEKIPATRIKNYWYDGVRTINKPIYDKITKGVELSVINEPPRPKASNKFNDIDNGLESKLEGSKNKHFVTKYERNAKYRAQAIAIHGTTCKACGFNFNRTYGKYGEGLIHVHHTVPVSTYKEPKKIDPEKDLIPLCANCHAIIHRRKDKTLSIKEVQRLVKMCAK